MIQRILAKQLPIVLLKWCPYVGAPLYRLPLPNLTLRRTVHDKRDWQRHWHGLCLSWLHRWHRPLLGPAYVSTSDGCSSQQSYLAAGKTETSLGLSHLCSSNWVLPLTIADFVPGWSCILKHVGSEWSLLSGWGMLGWLVVRNTNTPCSFNPPSLPKQNPHKQVAPSSEAEPRLPRALFLSHKAFQSDKGIHLPW